MKSKKYLLVFLIFLFACGGRQKEYGNYLHLQLKDDPTTLDPAFIVDVPGGALSAKIFNGLVRFDPEGKIVPDIASSWEISADGKTYHFRLRPGAKFHNGREVTARDFAFSFQRLLEPKTNSPRNWLLKTVKGAVEFEEGKAESVEGIREVSDYELIIELSQPFNLFLDFLAMPNTSVIPIEEVARNGSAFSDHPVGTGPFRLKEWKHNDRIVLEKNPHYFNSPARLEGIFYRVIPEDLTAAVEFEQGNLDLIEVPRAEFKKYTTEKPWRDRVQSRVGLNIYYLGFNCQKAPFNDPRLRRALNYALDREKIIAALLEGRAVPASGPVPPPLLPVPAGPFSYNYHPEKSRLLLQEVGIALPLKISLLFKADREVLSVAEVIQHYFREVGVETLLVQREWSAFKQAVNNGDYDLFYLSWWADYPSPENFLFPTFHSANWGPEGNRARFKDDRVDALLTRAHSELDPVKLGGLYGEIQARVAELAPWVFLWHKKDYMIAQPRVVNYRLPVIYNGDKFENIGLVAD